MAYTVILVDDEDEVRGRIGSKIEEVEAFEIIGTASNGYDALDLLDEMTPDVIITDIKMPYVDGIELTRSIKERYPTVKVAIISGYDDYSYLKEAINLDVAAYLSKPISTENIQTFLAKIKEKLDEEKAQVKRKEEIELTQIRARVLKLLLTEEDLSHIEHYSLEELGINVSSEFVLVSSEIKNSDGDIVAIEKKKNQCSLLTYDLISEVFTTYHFVFGKKIISIIEVKGEAFEKELDSLLYKIYNYLRKYLNVEIAIAVSSKAPFKNLSALYKQSKRALEESEITDRIPINYYEKLEKSSEKLFLDLEDVIEFKKNMRYMDEKLFVEYTKQCAKKINEDSRYDIFGIVMTLSGLLLEYANAVEVNISEALDINRIKTYIDDRNIDGFMKLIVQLTAQIKCDVISRKTTKSNEILTNILDYIENEFNNPQMSMDLVCEKFHISVSYLSTLFKKETDTTFNKYLVSKRIDHAKHLLATTEDKMVMIAEQCGYKDVYYFSHSFKRVTGSTPRRYRKSQEV